MNVIGFEHRATDLARGVIVIKAKRALESSEQREIARVLSGSGATPTLEDADSFPDARRIFALPWAPPGRADAALQKSAIDETGRQFPLEEMFFVKIETSIDSSVLVESNDLETSDSSSDSEADLDVDLDAAASGSRQIAVSKTGEVLFSQEADAVDEQLNENSGESTADDSNDDDESTDLSDAPGFSSDDNIWRNGAPPSETQPSFPVENLPERSDGQRWENLGLALKLAGESTEGEESVIRAFFALWLSVFQDERYPDLQAFERAHVVSDAAHRTHLLWVDSFTIPIDSGELGGFLLWVISRMSEILPIAWVRFEDGTSPTRYVHEDESFVLAGNPLSERFSRSGEEVALHWAMQQSFWKKPELAAMLVEVAVENDPDSDEGSQEAERLLRIALSWDEKSEALGYLLSVWVRRGDVESALTLARNSGEPRVIAQLLSDISEYAPAQMQTALQSLDKQAFSGLVDEDIGSLTVSIAKNASSDLRTWLSLIPCRDSSIPYLYNASFEVEKDEALAVLQRITDADAPPSDSVERTAYLRAWNNVCIHAHASGEFSLAASLADRAVVYANDNPHIFHAAACAYAANGQTDKALANVSAAITAQYDFIEKMETDPDLSMLAENEHFQRLFEEWRGARSDLN